MSAGDIKQSLDVFFEIFPRTYQRGRDMSECNCPRGKWETDGYGWPIWVPFPSSETKRIADLEKQVAELRAGLEGRE
jgi:hypothetical protein